MSTVVARRGVLSGRGSRRFLAVAGSWCVSSDCRGGTAV